MWAALGSSRTDAVTPRSMQTHNTANLSSTNLYPSARLHATTNICIHTYGDTDTLSPPTASTAQSPRFHTVASLLYQYCLPPSGSAQRFRPEPGIRSKNHSLSTSSQHQKLRPAPTLKRHHGIAPPSRHGQREHFDSATSAVAIHLAQ